MKIVLSPNPLGNTTVFSVDGNDLVKTSTALDFESVKSYLLVVTVTDGGSPQFSTDATVSIQVTGTNEFSPVFSNSTYSVSHSEVSRSVQSISQSVTGSAIHSVSPSVRQWVIRSVNQRVSQSVRESSSLSVSQ